MRYLFLMFLKYYREGRFTKDIAYFSALSAVVLCILFFFIISLLGIEFSIKGMGKNRLQDYIIMGEINFTVAVNFPTSKKDEKGEYIEEVEYYQCSKWYKSTENQMF